jgi:hypothetical protein
MKIISCFLFLASFLCSQCQLSWKATPKKYLNNVRVATSRYRQDSLQIVGILTDKIRQKMPPFESSDYSDTTQLFVDTIIYEKTLKKMLALVITQNPMSSKKYRLPEEVNYNFYFDAYCFLGEKLEDQEKWNLKWFNVLNLINYYDHHKASDRIKWKYFYELAAVRDTSGKSAFRYNANDVRFWAGPVWIQSNY